MAASKMQLNHGFLNLQNENRACSGGMYHGALCSEMAEIVQKVALVGSIDFGSSWLLFWE